MIIRIDFLEFDNDGIMMMTVVMYHNDDDDDDYSDNDDAATQAELCVIVYDWAFVFMTENYLRLSCDGDLSVARSQTTR